MLAAPLVMQGYLGLALSTISGAAFNVFRLARRASSSTKRTV